MHASAAIFAPIRIFDIGHHLDTALAHETDNELAYRFSPDYGPAGFKCCDCGAVRMFPNSLPNKPHEISTGYARVDGEQLCCYECADARQRAQLLDRTKPFYAYLSKLSGGARMATTWTGGKLGDVHSLGFSRAGWRGCVIARFHVRDVHGQWWQGRGAGDGMACTLRPMTCPDYARAWGGAKQFRDVRIGQLFRMDNGLSFSMGTIFRKVSARKYRPVMDATEYRIGSNRCAVVGLESDI